MLHGSPIGTPDALKGACPVWEGLEGNRHLKRCTTPSFYFMRHAPHIQNFPRYYAAMLRGLVTQHCKRLQREQQQLRPLEEAGPG